MKSRSETGGGGQIDQAAEGLLRLFRVFANPAIGVSFVTGAVLVVLGADVIVSLGSIVGGIVAGYLASVAIVIIGMIWSEGPSSPPLPPSSALERHSGPEMGLSDDDRPSLGDLALDSLFVLVPSVFALAGTILSARLLSGISREIVAVALVGSAVAIVLRAWREAGDRRAEEKARQVRWLRDRGAAAARDPEFLEQLQQVGWRADGPYDDMRAAYFRAWETVKEGRRGAGRAIWSRGPERPVPPPHDT